MSVSIREGVKKKKNYLGGIFHRASTPLVSAREKAKGVKQARELKICCAAKEMRVKRELLDTLGRRYEEIKKEITTEIKEIDSLRFDFINRKPKTPFFYCDLYFSIPFWKRL